MRRADFARRLWAQDPTLWGLSAPSARRLRQRLGWLRLPEAMATGLAPVRSFAAQVQQEGFRHAVALSAGGASLACESFRRAFASVPGHPVLEVLDSANPAAITALERRLQLERTLFFVAGAPGPTFELQCLMDYFFERVSRRTGAKAGRQFAAITEPGVLERAAVRRGFRKVFLNPAEAAGALGALSLSTLAPAAAAGIDLERLLSRARATARACAEEGPGNAALDLGAALAQAAASGRDKLTLSLAPTLEPLGLWIEQLISDGFAQAGRGLLPVSGEPLVEPRFYGSDRLFVRVGFKGQPEPAAEERLAALEAAGHPVRRLLLDDGFDLGSQFFLWEVALAAAGFLLGVDPFERPLPPSPQDQGMLAALQAGALSQEPAILRAGGLAAFADADLLTRLGARRGLDLPLAPVLAAHLGRRKPSDFIAVLAYVHPQEGPHSALETLRGLLRRRTSAAVAVRYGPRCRQTSDEGGLFLELVQPDTPALPVPGRGFGFGALHRALARGDFEALAGQGRRVLRLDLGAACEESLRAIVNAVKEMPE